MAIIKIIGAGLAGSEAAWQCARRGMKVELFEMRPVSNDARAPDRGLRRTGLLELAEIRQRKYGSVAAEGRDAAGGFACSWRSPGNVPSRLDMRWQWTGLHSRRG